LADPTERRLRLQTKTISVYRLDVPETDRVVIDGLPTTTRLRTAVDVAHLMPIVQAQPILDRLLVLDTVQLGELTTVIEASRRSGSAQARALMRSAADLAAAESERHARRVLREAGVTGWTPNHSVTVRGGRTIKVDLALKRLRIAIEVKGWIFHSKSDRAKGDDDRVTDLQLAGWFVIPVGWLELMSDPEGFVAKVLAAVAARTPHAA
jgi:very-short-patch-repair endonuclease